MREILFRGRDISGQWHYGVPLIFNEDYVCIAKLNEHNKTVEYKTLGQYTGLIDNNGNKIFEGDILERKHKELVNHSQKMTVNYIPYKACFSVVDIGGGNVTFISDYINNKYELEVIGNIHDNPELLEIER